MSCIYAEYLFSWNTFREILASSANLEELQLHISPLTGTKHRPGVELRVFHRLHRVHTIILQWLPKQLRTSLLPSVRARSLRHLVIWKPQTDDGDTALTALLLSASEFLKELDLGDIELLFPTLVAFLENGPSLKTLIIRDLQFQPEGLEGILKSLPPCQQLQEVFLTALWPRKLKDDAFQEMAVRRHQKGCVPLEIVYRDPP